MQQTVIEVIEKIKADAQKHSDEPRFVRVVSEGDEIRQGDIYLYPVNTAPTNLEAQQSATRQLAPGESKGSRHIVVTPSVKIFNKKNPNALDGPVLFAEERFVVTHPEHADISCPPGTYNVTYQRDHMKEEMERVRD